MTASFHQNSLRKPGKLCLQLFQRGKYTVALFMGVRWGGKNEFLPPLEIGTKKQKFLENVKSGF